MAIARKEKLMSPFGGLFIAGTKRIAPHSSVMRMRFGYEGTSN